MRRRPDNQKIERALARTPWLGDLSLALDRAYQLALLLAARDSDSREAIMLRTRIQAARAEIEALRRNAPSCSSGEIDPDRSKFIPWQFPTERSDD